MISASPPHRHQSRLQKPLFGIWWFSINCFSLKFDYNCLYLPRMHWRVLHDVWHHLAFLDSLRSTNLSVLSCTMEQSGGLHDFYCCEIFRCSGSLTIYFSLPLSVYAQMDFSFASLNKMYLFSGTHVRFYPVVEGRTKTACLTSWRKPILFQGDYTNLSVHESFLSCFFEIH